MALITSRKPPRLARVPITNRRALNPSHPLNQGLVSWWLAQPWLFGQFTWFDILGGNHGTLTNMDVSTAASGWGPTARPGGAAELRFDGVNDYVTKATPLNVPAPNAPLSIAVWLRTRVQTQTEVFVLNDTSSGGASNAIQIEIGSSSTVHVTKAGGTVLVESNIVPTINRWYHITYTFDGVTHRIFLDGIQAGSGTTAPNTGALLFQWFGDYRNDGLGLPWSGALDDSRLYRRQLAVSEVAALYEASLQGYPQVLRSPRRVLGFASTTIIVRPTPVAGQWRMLTPGASLSSVTPSPVKGQWRIPTPANVQQDRLKPVPVTAQWRMPIPIASPPDTTKVTPGVVRGQWRIPTPGVGTLALRPTPIAAQWRIVAPPTVTGSLIRPAPIAAQWRIGFGPPAAGVGNLFLKPPPVALRAAIIPPRILNTNAVRTDGLSARWRVAIPLTNRQVIPRDCGPDTDAALAQPFIAGDWLVQAPTIGLKLSYDFNPDGTWEHRIASLSDPEVTAPPGGGIVAIANVTIGVIEDQSGQSILELWNRAQTIEAVTLTIDFLLAGAATTLRLFTGRIDTLVQKDAITLITAVDDSLHKNPLLPQKLLTTDIFSNLASALVTRPQPIVYGRGDRVGAAPLLFVDTPNNLYLTAGHAMSMTSQIAVLSPGARVFVATDTTAVVCNISALFQLSAAIQEFRFNTVTPALQISRNEDVSQASNAIDGNSATLAVVGTSNLALNLDGQGRLGVAMVASATSAQRGNNTVLFTLTNHRRIVGSDPTVTGTFVVNTIDPTTLVALRTNLATSPPYRHTLNPQTTVLTAPAINLGGTEAVEVLLTATNEGGVGTSSEAYEVGDISIQSFYQSPGDTNELFLYQKWTGRQDPDGTVTGVSGTLLTQPDHVIASLVLLELGAGVDADSFAAAFTFYAAQQMVFDGGVGTDWFVERTEARKILDDLARQCFGLLYPTFSGAWGVKPYDPTHTKTAMDFTIGNILMGAGSEKALPKDRPPTFEATIGSLKDVYTRFEVHYAYNVGTRKYDQVYYADQNGTNSPDAATVVQPCQQAFNRYGKLPTLSVDAYWIADDATAQRLLQHLVGYFASQRIWCAWETTLRAICLTVGDFVTITHPLLPASEQGATFEIHRIRYMPTQGRIALQASRRASLAPVLRPLLLSRWKVIPPAGVAVNYVKPAPIAAQWTIVTPRVVVGPATTWSERWEVPDYARTTVFTDF